MEKATQKHFEQESQSQQKNPERQSDNKTIEKFHSHLNKTPTNESAGPSGSPKK